MRKTILLILICSLLLLTVTSCLQNNKNEQTTPQNTTEEATPSETTTCAMNNQNPPLLGTKLDKNSDLIVELTDYLKRYWGMGEPPPISFAHKINDIKNGAQPLHIVFDSSNYYFVCGYYNVPNEHDEYLYCCAPEYTWVGYKSETEIQEYLNDMECVVTFQINKTLGARDILSDERITPIVEYFQIFNPVFENGVNVAAPISFNKALIYLNKTNSGTLLLNWQKSSESITILCVNLEGQWYIPIWLDTLKAEQAFVAQTALRKDHIVYDFEEHYEAIVDVMDTEKYYTNNGDGYIVYYGVVSLENFVERVIK